MIVKSLIGYNTLKRNKFLYYESSDHPNFGSMCVNAIDNRPQFFFQFRDFS